MDNAAELKESLDQRAKDIILVGLNLTPNHSGFILCPLHQEKTPSMSWYKDGLMWRCHACGGKIDIYDYLTKFENLSFIEAKEKVADMIDFTLEPNRVAKKQYSLPQVVMRELSQEAIDLMAVRKITKETLDAWQVKESTWNGVNVFVFQYFQDGILKYVSYREIKQGGFKGGCEKNTEAILWGMWHTEDNKPLVITEGQCDTLAVWQSGYKNVISIPNGANNLAWIENCWEWLKGREIIFWADNDKPGLALADTLSRRLDNVKVVSAENLNLKDANEVLYKYGPDKVLEIIENAVKGLPNGLLDMARIEYKISNESGIETGFYEYDSYIEDWREGELTVIFGRNGEGKTTFVSQIIAHCMEKKVKTFLYSGEMSEFKIQDWLYRQIIGNKKEYMREVQAKYRVKFEIKQEIIKRIKQWHEGTLYLFDQREEEIDKDTDKFFDLMKLAAKRYGVKLFIIDNLMSKLEENADSLYSDQANFVQRCKNFARNYKVHVVLVAHPNKVKDEIKKEEGNLTKTDISGSNNIPNKADNIIAVERIWMAEREYDVIITSLKNRESGQRKAFKYMFSQETLRFYNNYTKEEVIYGWENVREDELFHEVEKPEGCPF